jgi:hypothetical protein
VRLHLGTPVRCADDVVRELADVVIDSGRTCVTHVVVQPHSRPEGARLVPMELTQEAPDGRDDVVLRCTAQALDGMDSVHEFAYLLPGELPPTDPKWDVGVEDVYRAPEYAAAGLGEYIGDFDGISMSYDRVPKGEIELRHVSDVYSADRHHLGCVKGVVIDDADRVTYLLLERGHWWWKREIPVPTDAISRFETDCVTLGVTKRKLEALSRGKGSA